jgi:hypothetical protein
MKCNAVFETFDLTYIFGAGATKKFADPALENCCGSKVPLIITVPVLPKKNSIATLLPSAWL